MAFFLIFLFAILSPRVSLSTNFKVVTDCTCQGYVASYECTIGGNGSSIWTGTAFDCSLSSNRIILLHSEFKKGTSVTCNDGLLVGQSLSVTNGVYTSRLDANITASLDGGNVECIYNNGSSSAIIIGSSLISITRDPFGPPSNVRVVSISPGVLEITWDPVTVNCPAVHYEIESNCSFCPDIAETNSVSCSIQNLHSDISCDFAVRSVVCGNIVGERSVPIHFTLKLPDAITIATVTRYGTDEEKLLLNADFKFQRAESVFISDGVESPPLFYMVYFNSSGKTCGSANISASSCGDMCTSTLPSQCYKENEDITMLVSSTSAVGVGLKRTTFIGNINNYVDINFESSTLVICTFRVGQSGSKVCSIGYGPCQRRSSNSTQGFTSPDSPNQVILQLPVEIQNSDCYTINATINESLTVLMSGSRDNTLSCWKSVFVLVAIIATFTVLTLLSWAILGYFIKRKRYTCSKHDVFSNDSGTVNCQHITEEWKPPPLFAHVVVEIDSEDTTSRLLKVLKMFKDKNVGVTDIMISDENSRAQKVYLRCRHELDVEMRESITHQIESVECVTRLSSRGNEHYHSGYKCTRRVQKKPGMMYELLNGFKELRNMDEEGYKQMSIKDIVIRETLSTPGRPDEEVIDLYFDSDHVLPDNWEYTFDNHLVGLSGDNNS